MKNSSIYPREQYLARLRPFYHSTDMIKVVPGIRRCGKSCLLQSIRDELQAGGVPSGQLVSMDLDSRQYRSVTTADALDGLPEKRISGSELTYVFIDEVQNVRNFEPVLNSWREEGNVSIFVTGSNSCLLSGELITKLTGRHIELPMFPLNFQEYLGMQDFLGKTALSTRQPLLNISAKAVSPACRRSMEQRREWITCAVLSRRSWRRTYWGAKRSGREICLTE